jgi:asparagine synthase (glutamine-hydrolysing)
LGWYNDERPYVKAIAALHPNMDLVLTSSTTPHWIEIDPTAFFEAGGVPARNVSNIGWLIPRLEPVTQAGINTLLVGDSGNMAWSWDGLRGLSDLFKNGHWLNLARELALIQHHRPYDQGWKTILRSQVLSPLEPPGVARWRKRLTKREIEPWTSYSAVSPDFAKEINLYDRCRLIGHDKPFYGSANGLGLRLGMLNRYYSGGVSTIMRAVTGVENRDPLADVRLLEFCFSLPQDQYLKNGLCRRLPRLTLADRLPSSVLKNNRRGLQNPEISSRVNATRGGLLDEINALEKVPLAARCIDLPRLSAIVKTWPDNIQVKLVLPRAINIGRFLRWAEYL